MLSALFVLQGLLTPGFPVMLPEMVSIALLRRDSLDNERTTVRFRAVHVDRELFNTPLEIDFQGKFFHYAYMRAGGVVLEAPGNCTVELFIGERPAATYTFGIVGPENTSA